MSTDGERIRRMRSVGTCSRRSACIPVLNGVRTQVRIELTKMNEKVCFGLSIVMLSALMVALPLSAQGESAFVDGFIERMSVEEKVGQLFLVTFMGNDVGPDSDIAQLITEYRVGGMVLSASNGNFTNSEDTPQQVAKLTDSLQELAFLTSEENYIPLFIAVGHEGDGYPYTPLRGGMTALPNQMALGATWSEENVDTVGEIAGRELAALGINMLFGPSLDVLNNPRPTLQGELGTRVFGGDPYWVGKLGRAYIRGVHRGSGGKVVTVAKHFPGYGDSDRSPYEEVATINKSMQELRRIELPPFFAVTEAKAVLVATDALMTSHIRYRGFQGNIRQLTRPISFDAQGLGALMALPEFKPWRDEGGLMVTDALGVPAVRKYYDPLLQNFPHKRIAQEALLAGNDLLVLSKFALTDDWPDEFENIKSTIEFFREKYESDPNFQAKVDEALKRILTLKHRLYPRFTLEAVQVGASRLAEVGQGREEIFRMAREAITLIYPGPEELADRLPSPPLIDEDVLIFTDAREVCDCFDCPSFALIKPHALEETIIQLYGPEATGQVTPERIHSLTFSQLKRFLVSEATEEVDIGELIERADWIIFAMLNVDPQNYPQSDAVKAFLRQRADVLRGKKNVVLAYGAPYYLDTTEISKLTAYYGIYSKVEPFIEASVRALFQEFTPGGASPVSVEGINYNLITQMEPDPDQIIQVMLADLPQAGEETPMPIDVDVGDTLRLKTGVILDKNGRPVPDGTPVTFRLFYPAESLELPRQEVTAVDGVAETTIVLERGGQLEITAASDPARKSTTLVVTIQGDEPATFATLVPAPTSTPTPTVTPTPTPTPPPPTPAPSPTPTREAKKPVQKGKARLDGGNLLFSLVGISFIGGVGCLVQRKQDRSTKLRSFLLSVVWGLVGYNLYGLRTPGTGLFQRLSDRWGATLICLACSSGYVLWQMLKSRLRPPTQFEK